MEYLILIIILIIAGLIAGYTSGLFGIGGGVVLVPTFLTMLPLLHAHPSVAMHVAVATSLALVVPAAIMSTRKQLKMGKLDLAMLKIWIIPIIVGVIIAAIVMNAIPTYYLKILFTCYLLVCILLSIFKSDASSESMAGPPAITRNIGGGIIGFLSVLLGIGGGTFTVPFYRYFNYPLKNAIALSSTTGLFIGLGGAIGAIFSGWHDAGLPLFSLGYVNWLAFLIITPLVMIAAPYGVNTANTLPASKLRWVYTGFLIVVFLYMLYKII